MTKNTRSILKKTIKLVLISNLLFTIAVLIYFHRWGLKISMTNELEKFLPLLFINAIFSISIVLLVFKDELLKKRGMSKKEITLKGVVWLGTPAFFVIAASILTASWYIAQSNHQIVGFVIGITIGIVVGFLLLYRLLSKTKRQLKLGLVKQKIPKMIFWVALVSIVLNITSGHLLIDAFLDSHTLLTSVLMGLLGSFMLFVAGIHLLLAIIKKETFLDIEYFS